MAMALREMRSAKVLIIAGVSAAHYLGLRRDPEVKFIYNYIKTNTLDSEKLRRYTITMYESCHFLLYSSLDDPDGQAVNAIIRAAEGHFDYVVTDVAVDVSAKDMIHVDVLAQCDREIEAYFDRFREFMKTGAGKRIQIVGQYQNMLSHYRLRQIRKVYRQKSIQAIPMDVGLHRAVIDQTAIQYMKLVLGPGTKGDSPLRDHLEEIMREVERLEVLDERAS